MLIGRAFLSCWVVYLGLVSGAEAQSEAPGKPAEVRPAAELVDRVLRNQKRAEEALDVYERIERQETRKNPSDPSPVSLNIARVIPSGTGMVKFAVDADGKPSDVAAYRARLEGLERALEQIDNGNRSQREAVEKYGKRRKDRLELIDAMRTAFSFKLVGQETRGDRVLTKYEMSPKPAFKPTTRFTVIFPKVHGFVWIDENSEELARIEGEVTEDISLGLFLGKIYKGSHFMQESYEVKPGLWLPSFTQFDFDGRKLFSAFSIHERTFYTHYRYIGPPHEALEVIRKELALAELGKTGAATADP